MTDEVRLDVGARVLEAVADAGLRAEMDDPVDVDAVGERLQRGGVGEVDPLEAEAVAELARETVEPRLLERRIVIIVEIVDRRRPRRRARAGRAPSRNR